MAHECCSFYVGTYHHPWTIHETQHGNIKCVTKLDETRTFIGCIRVDRSSQVMRIVGDDPHWVSFNPNKRSDHTDPKLLPDFKDRVNIRDCMNDFLHIIEP